jgi:hypothetical protein
MTFMIGRAGKVMTVSQDALAPIIVHPLVVWRARVACREAHRSVAFGCRTGGCNACWQMAGGFIGDQLRGLG